MVDSIIEEFKDLRIRLDRNYGKGYQIDWISFPSWCTRFFKSLDLTSDQGMEAFIDRIAAASTNKERINIVLNQPIVKGLMDLSIQKSISYIDSLSKENPKSLERSRNLMKKGSEFFKQNKITEAFACFNEGIQVSPFPFDAKDASSSSNLSMCLVKRSRCYQALKRYPESWFDMKDAVANMKEERLMEQLMKSKKALLVEIASDGSRSDQDEETGVLADIDYTPMDVLIRPENRNLHGASESLEMTWSKEKGRYIIASSPIKSGTSIIAESAYASWLQPTEYEKYCYHCLRPLDNRSFPCRRCILISYCSSECSQKNWSLYHRKECKFLPLLKHMSIGHLAFKTLLTAGLKTALEENEKPIAPPQSHKKFTNTYRDVRTLQDQCENLANVKWATFTTCAVFMAQLTQAMGLVDAEPVDRVAELYMKTILQIVHNSLAIYDDRVNSESDLGISFLSTSGGKKIGIGLYATASLLSHSCAANNDRLFIGSKVVVNTRTSIPKGGEVTICYGPSISASFKQRQKSLQEDYYFTCYCDVCKTGK